MTYGCAENPDADWNSAACVDEMRKRGIAWLPYKAEAMAELAEIFRNMPDMEELFEDTADGTFYGCEVPSPRGGARFILNKSAISENMRWLWAHDEETLALFDEFAAAANLVPVLNAVDGSRQDLMLYAGSFIIVKGTQLADAETTRHADLGHRRIPRCSSFTCLTTLTDLPGSVGGLQFWPWENPVYTRPPTAETLKAPGDVLKYSPGKFIAFDGHLKHRTEPFQYDRALSGTAADVEKCNTFEADGHIRVLVSLAFGPSDKRCARYVHKMLRKQTCHEEALIRQSPFKEVDIESDLDTSDDDGGGGVTQAPPEEQGILRAVQEMRRQEAAA